MGEVTPIAPPRLVTAAEVAEYLTLPESSVLRMARKGIMPAIKVGGARLWRFRMEDVEKWVIAQSKQPQKPTTYKPRAKKEDEQKAS